MKYTSIYYVSYPEDTREDLRIAVVNLASVAHLLMEMILINKDQTIACYTDFLPRPTYNEE